ncbi:MAG: hypothetical protein M5R41_15075 [Bacteroidia bacterium]|nr:hypothetical protein [Bacteroidia bacterium]
MTETIASWHPFLVHFAVAFAIGSAVFDILDFFLQRRRFEETGLTLMIAALPFLLLAVLSGNLAEPYARAVTPAAHLQNHISYANIAVWVFFAAALWRTFLHFKRQYTGKRKVAYVFVITFAAVSVYLAAMHGGRIRHTPERFILPDSTGTENVIAPAKISAHLS